MFIYGAPMVFYLASENENNGLTALPFFLAGENLAWAVRKEFPRFASASGFSTAPTLPFTGSSPVTLVIPMVTWTA